MLHCPICVLVVAGVLHKRLVRAMPMEGHTDFIIIHVPYGENYLQINIFGDFG